MTLHMIKIPRNRVGVLIGPEGQTKEEIEGRSGVYLEIDGENGEVTIDDANAFEPVVALKTRDVVRAIGRGFSPENAFRLYQEDAYLDILDLTDYVGKEKKALDRVRARIIGSGGKARKFIEDSTGVNMSIFGKTVGILGDMNEVLAARQAVDMLIDGAAHGTVFKFLEKKRKELRLQDIGL